MSVKCFKKYEEMFSNVDVTENAIINFNNFIEGNIFNYIPEDINYELYDFSTTLSFLNMRFFFKLGDYELSFIVKGDKSMDFNSIFTDYITCSFAFLYNGELITGVRVYEGFFDDFREFFYHLLDRLREFYNQS